MGAAIGEWLLGKRLGNRALAWGALFCILPHVFGSIVPFLDTARTLSWKSGGSHSLLILGLAGWGLARALGKLWKREKISAPEAGKFIAAVWIAHLFLDCLTTQGAAIFWPVLGSPVSLNVLHPLDPLFTLPLVVTVIWMAFVPEVKPKRTRSKKPVQLSKRVKLLRWGLGLSAGYAVLAFGFKLVASSGFEADLARRDAKMIRRMEAPTPFNAFLWRSVADQGDDLWVGYRTIFELHKTPVRWTVYPKRREDLESVADLRETKTLVAASDGWFLARPHAKGAWVGDLRFPEFRVWGNKKTMVDSRLVRTWVIDAKNDGDRLREYRMNPTADPDYLKRLFLRVFGYREEWEANPRLGGVSGSLPEFLPVQQ